jgi:hypothetical protein
MILARGKREKNANKEKVPMATTANDPKKTMSSIRALLEETQPGPADMVEFFRATREHIPQFGPLQPIERLELRAASVTDPLFVQASINTVGASRNIESLVGRSTVDLRRETDDAAQWTAVEDELRATLEGVAAANLVRRHRIGLTALQTYNTARQLVRSKEHAHLLPHVAEMKRLNRFGKKRAVKAPVTPTAPATVPPVPPQK